MDDVWGYSFSNTQMGIWDVWIVWIVRITDSENGRSTGPGWPVAMPWIRTSYRFQWTSSNTQSQHPTIESLRKNFLPDFRQSSLTVFDAGRFKRTAVVMLGSAPESTRVPGRPWLGSLGPAADPMGFLQDFLRISWGGSLLSSHWLGGYRLIGIGQWLFCKPKH